MSQSLYQFSKELRSNNSKLFNKLFTDYYVNLCRFAFTFIRDKGISEEIVQEIFISIWERRDNLKINSSVRAFLYTSVKNRALNYLRNEKTRNGHENNFAVEQINKIDEIIDFCNRDELQYHIDDAVNNLPDQCQQIFKMSRHQNLTYNEIAKQLNISPKTVENQMTIALKKLRIKLAPYLNCILTLF